jgi:hypothetical protein
VQPQPAELVMGLNEMVVGQARHRLVALHFV